MSSLISVGQKTFQQNVTPLTQSAPSTGKTNEVAQKSLTPNPSSRHAGGPSADRMIGINTGCPETPPAENKEKENDGTPSLAALKHSTLHHDSE